MSDNAAPLFTLVIPKYSDFRKTLKLRNADGSFVDLTGYVIDLQVREDYDDQYALISLTSVQEIDGTITIDGIRAYIVIPEEVTASLDFERGVYDVRFESPDGAVERVVEGPAVLSLGSTR